jgi:hypothetical protein
MIRDDTRYTIQDTSLEEEDFNLDHASCIKAFYTASCIKFVIMDLKTVC